MTAEQALSEVGVVFEAGAWAKYDIESSQLTVRNTRVQLDLVDAYADSVRSGIEKQIYLSSLELRVPRNSVREIEGLRIAREVTTRISRPQKNQPLAWQKISEAKRDKIISDVAKLPNVELLQPPGVMIRSGQSYAWDESASMEIFGQLGPDECTIDLSVRLKDSLTESPASHLKVASTIWDSDVLVICTPDSNEMLRVIMIHGEICDPAGMKLKPDSGRSRLQRYSLDQLHRYPGERPLYSKHYIPDSVRKLLPLRERLELQKSASRSKDGARFLATDQLYRAAEAFRGALEMTPDHLFFRARRQILESRLEHAQLAAHVFQR